MTNEQTDFRALCAELVEKIDYTWGDIPEDVYELLDRARTALAQLVPEGVTDEELYQFWESHPELGLTCDEPVKLLRAGLTHFARPVIKPVPVSERPWKREGWCDDRGYCWMRRKYEPDGVTWRLIPHPDQYAAAYFRESLPHHALPIPTTH
jgi:hypothetical protein